MLYFDHPKYGLRALSNHSVVVAIGGLVYIGYGSMMLLTWTYEGPRASAISAGLTVAPIGFWGTLWVVSGVLALLSARWPVINETWGYTALAGTASVWAAVYLAGLFFDDNTIAETGGALVWGLVAFLWWAIARLVNPDRTIVIEVEVEPDGRG